MDRNSKALIAAAAAIGIVFGAGAAATHSGETPELTGDAYETSDIYSIYGGVPGEDFPPEYDEQGDSEQEFLQDFEQYSGQDSGQEFSPDSPEQPEIPPELPENSPAETNITRKASGSVKANSPATGKAPAVTKAATKAPAVTKAPAKTSAKTSAKTTQRVGELQPIPETPQTYPATTYSSYGGYGGYGATSQTYPDVTISTAWTYPLYAPPTSATPATSATVATPAPIIPSTTPDLPVTPPPVSAPVVNPAPAISMENSGGQAVNLSDFRGKPVVLNFWASWCGPCKVEMPFFSDMYGEFGGEVQFVMLNMTKGWSDTREKAAKLVADSGWNFPVYYDTKGEGSVNYGITSVPRTVFIGADGGIRSVHSGSISERDLRAGLLQLTVDN